MKNYNRIDNPAFNEFLYSLLFNAPIEAKRVIPPRFLKYVNSETEAKKFIKRATMEEARTLLSYLGVQHFVVLVGQDNVNFKELKTILEKFKNNKNIASLKDIIDLKLFVTSDRELITLLGLVSQSIHHRAYTMNLELTRTSYHVRGWKKRLDDQETANAYADAILLSRTLLNASFTMHKIGFLFKLNQLEMEVLLLLYPAKHMYTQIDIIFEAFIGRFSKTKMSACIKRLIVSQHIQKSSISVGREYALTSIGIRIVNEYMDAVMHANNFH